MQLKFLGSLIHLGKLILKFTWNNRRIWIANQFWTVSTKENLTLPDIEPFYKARMFKIVWCLGRHWEVKHWNTIEQPKQAWAFIRTPCSTEAASRCPGNRGIDTKGQIPDNRCKAKERRSIAGWRCGNKAVLFYLCF